MAWIVLYIVFLIELVILHDAAVRKGKKHLEDEIREYRCNEPL
jgi:hypothetical protein